jgi:hypothetical protein
MFAFLLSPLGKIALYIAGAVAAIGIIWGAIAYHDSQIKKEALFKYNQTQLQETLKDKADELNRLGKIDDAKDSIIIDTNNKNQIIKEKTDAINDFITQRSDASNTPVDTTIIETLKKLKELDNE